MGYVLDMSDIKSHRFKNPNIRLCVRKFSNSEFIGYTSVPGCSTGVQWALTKIIENSSYRESTSTFILQISLNSSNLDQGG